VVAVETLLQLTLLQCDSVYMRVPVYTAQFRSLLLYSACTDSTSADSLLGRSVHVCLCLCTPAPLLPPAVINQPIADNQARATETHRRALMLLISLEAPLRLPAQVLAQAAAVGHGPATALQMQLPRLPLAALGVEVSPVAVLAGTRCMVAAVLVGTRAAVLAGIRVATGVEDTMTTVMGVGCWQKRLVLVLLIRSRFEQEGEVLCGCCQTNLFLFGGLLGVCLRPVPQWVASRVANRLFKTAEICMVLWTTDSVPLTHYHN
jgi:hypothetical protein